MEYGTQESSTLCKQYLMYDTCNVLIFFARSQWHCVAWVMGDRGQFCCLHQCGLSVAAGIHQIGEPALCGSAQEGGVCRACHVHLPQVPPRRPPRPT